MSTDFDVTSLLEDAAGTASDALSSTPVDLAIKAVEYLLGSIKPPKQPSPGEFCVYEPNPLELTKTAETGDLAEWSTRGGRIPFRLVRGDYGWLGNGYGSWSVKFEDKPEEIHCEGTGEFSYATRHRFDDLYQLAQSKNLRGAGTLNRLSDRDLARAIFWASWKILSHEEAWARYKLETEPAILEMVIASRNDPERQKGLEVFYGGRIYDEEWHWNDEPSPLHSGGVLLKDIPLWIPLDSNAKPLAHIYMMASEAGLDNEDLQKIAFMDPLTGIAPKGTKFENLKTKEEKRRYFANAHVIAAAKAAGDVESYRKAEEGLQTLQQELGWCAPKDQSCLGQRPNAPKSVGRWSQDELQAAASRLGAIHQKLQSRNVRAGEYALTALQEGLPAEGKKYKSTRKWVIAGLAVAAIAGGGLWWWRKKRGKRRGRRKRRWRR